MILDQLISALVETKNEAADELLLEALRLGNPQEKTLAMNALMRRQTVRGLSGTVEQYDKLPESLQLEILAQIKLFHHALR